VERDIDAEGVFARQRVFQPLNMLGNLFSLFGGRDPARDQLLRAPTIRLRGTDRMTYADNRDSVDGEEIQVEDIIKNMDPNYGANLLQFKESKFVIDRQNDDFVTQSAISKTEQNDRTVMTSW
jgi:hypothetical protein